MIFDLTANSNGRKLPALNPNYPADVSVFRGSDANATFVVSIETDGRPAEYTYQWYENGSPVSGATGAEYTKTGLTSAETRSVYCEVTNKAGTVTSRVATLTVKESIPTFTYSGTSQLIDDGDGNWRIKLKTSGTFTFTDLGNAVDGIDVFCVGGGGGNPAQVDTNVVNSGGGGGGYTKTGKSITPTKGTPYTVTIGAGGGRGANGGTTSAFGVSANGGNCAVTWNGGGGNGGSGGGAGGFGSGRAAGSDGGSYSGKGSNGDGGAIAGGTGQGSTTREFGESSGTLYAGGGAGYGGTAGSGGGGASNANGSTNTGGGAGGSYLLNAYTDSHAARSGGSGIVVIRNHRS